VAVACAHRVGQPAQIQPLKLVDFVGSVRRLAWAQLNGCQWETGLCSLVAQGGDLEALQWAREHGCPWSAATLTDSATR